MSAVSIESADFMIFICVVRFSAGANFSIQPLLITKNRCSHKGQGRNNNNNALQCGVILSQVTLQNTLC